MLIHWSHKHALLLLLLLPQMLSPPYPQIQF
jgi:hypothetical protein